MVALVVYALRACLPPRRRLGLLLPAAGALLFGLLAHVVEGATDSASFAAVASTGLFGIVLPIGCLVTGDAVMGAEVRAGTLHYTWLSPVPRPAIILARWVAGAGAAFVSVSVPCALAAIVAGVPEAAPSMLLSAGAGAAAYVALFVMIGAWTRRAVVWSLAGVVLGEWLLGGALDGLAQLSPGWLAQGAFGALASGAGELVRTGVPAGWPAVWRLAVVSAVALALASWRLAELRLTGPTD